LGSWTVSVDSTNVSNGLGYADFRKVSLRIHFMLTECPLTTTQFWPSDHAAFQTVVGFSHCYSHRPRQRTSRCLRRFDRTELFPRKANSRLLNQWNSIRARIGRPHFRAVYTLNALPQMQSRRSLSADDPFVICCGRYSWPIGQTPANGF
jgi:hypothetical protein